MHNDCKALEVRASGDTEQMSLIWLRIQNRFHCRHCATFKSISPAGSETFQWKYSASSAALYDLAESIFMIKFND